MVRMQVSGGPVFYAITRVRDADDGPVPGPYCAVAPVFGCFWRGFLLRAPSTQYTEVACGGVLVAGATLE